MKFRKINPKNEEAIKKLAERVVYEGNWEEAKYILKLHEYYYKERGGKNATRYEVLYGEVEEIEIKSRIDVHRLNAKYREILLIPKKIPTVIRFYEHCDILGLEKHSETIYVLTSDGWKSIDVFSEV